MRVEQRPRDLTSTLRRRGGSLGPSEDDGHGPLTPASPTADDTPERLGNKVAAHAVDFLRIEGEAILEAAKRLDVAAFGLAVDILAACRGKALLAGAGTSGIIARKIAATMTSTGTPALFLHPGDAVHGGLGIAAPGDVLVAISNGGETEEILNILPYLREREIPLIAIVGNLQSTLGRHAAVALDARADREACPLDLAPTASTAVALAVGDALALTLLERRALTPEAFARNHPSGRLGRRLTLTVGDVLGPRPELPSVSGDATWLTLVTTISAGGLGAAVVLDNDRRLAGIVTDGDFRRAAERAGSAGLSGLQARDIMTSEPTVVRLNALAIDALDLMENRRSQISVLPVVDGESRCVGIVRLHDLVRSGIL